jgi:putative transposase
MNPPEPHRKRNKKYNIAGHVHFLTFSVYHRQPLLTNDLWRSWLADSIRNKCDEFQIALWAYVFMPEHVHLLLKPRRSNYNLSDFEQSAKLSFTRKMIVNLTRSKAALIEKFRVNDGYKIWQEGGGHDLNIWSMKKAIEKAEYCHWNPIKRQLVKQPEQWRWSSFRWLVLGKREGEPLKLDDWDERLLDAEPHGTRLNGETGGTHE